MKLFKFQKVFFSSREGIKEVGIENSTLPPKFKLSLNLLLPAASSTGTLQFPEGMLDAVPLS